MYSILGRERGCHLKGSFEFELQRAIAVASLRPERLFRVTCERGAQISRSEIWGSLGGLRRWLPHLLLAADRQNKPALVTLAGRRFKVAPAAGRRTG